jgi:MFS transporter
MFLILWSTQSLSSLGSAMTSFALVIWSYQQNGSALTTSLLSICSYAPYVAMSIFAGALSDRWNKKYTMLVSDTLAALSTLAVLFLLKSGQLRIGHLYLLNAVNGLMNTVQQPASAVSVSLLTPRKYYQRISALNSLSNSLITVLTPVIATALLTFSSIDTVILLDLATCIVAVSCLALLITIPETGKGQTSKAEPLFISAKKGLQYLHRNRGILDLILFLAAINLVASMYNAALPAMLLSRKNGGKAILGMVNTCAGLATLVGSVLVSLAPPPRSRVRVICNALLFSMSTENLVLALGRTPLAWCIGAILGWIFIPVMNANMDALLRSYIPVEVQGRVYSARNALQFFTIPLGYFLGGLLVDTILEPLMASQAQDSILVALVGSGKGSGAAILYLIIAVLGVMVCLIFRRDRQLWALEDRNPHGTV